MIRPKGFIFDYGGTLDTQGCHWGKMIWHAYQRVGVPVKENDFRDAYVYAERTLGRNPIIQSSYTFHKTLQVKLRIEMEYLCEQKLLTGDVDSWQSAVLEDLYGEVKRTVAQSRQVLTLLAAHYPLVLVSNFYGNIHVVLEELQLSGLFKTVIESAVVGVRKPDPAIFTGRSTMVILNKERVRATSCSTSCSSALTSRTAAQEFSSLPPSENT